MPLPCASPSAEETCQEPCATPARRHDACVRMVDARPYRVPPFGGLEATPANDAVCGRLVSWERWRADNLAGWEDRVPIHTGPGVPTTSPACSPIRHRLSATVRHDREALGPLCPASTSRTCTMPRGGAGCVARPRRSGRRASPTPLRCSVAGPAEETRSAPRRCAQTVRRVRWTKHALRACGPRPALLGASHAPRSPRPRAFVNQGLAPRDTSRYAEKGRRRGRRRAWEAPSSAGVRAARRGARASSI